MEKKIVAIKDSLEMLGFIKTNGTQCRFVSMVSQTEVKNIRKGCPFKGVVKVSRRLGMVNVNYVASVNRKIAAQFGVDVSEVDYEAGEVWYKHIRTADDKALPIVVNKKNPDNGEYYLQFFPTSSVSSYVMPDGNPVAKNDLEPWFYKSDKPEYKPVVISINLNNIKELRASGVIMQAEDLEEAEAILHSAEA
jgi:hypothetical protein